jgi:hypothetical protein
VVPCDHNPGRDGRSLNAASAAADLRYGDDDKHAIQDRMLTYLESMTTGLRTSSLWRAQSQSESAALSVGETRGMRVIRPSVSPHS